MLHFKPRKSITRIEQYTQPDADGERRVKVKGWYVRVSFQGKIHKPKLFSDAKYGGMGKALQAAILYRNTLEKKLRKPRTEMPVVARLSPRNTSGFARVSRRKKHFRQRGNRKPYVSEVFELTWTEEGRVCKRTRSISKYGEKEALRQILEIRSEVETRIYGAPIIRDEKLPRGMKAQKK